MTTKQRTFKQQEISLRTRIERILLWIAVVLVTLIALYPFLWAVITSFKPQREALQPTLIPFLQFDPIDDNWDAELSLSQDATQDTLNTCVQIIAGAVAVGLIMSVLSWRELIPYKPVQQYWRWGLLLLTLALILRELNQLDNENFAALKNSAIIASGATAVALGFGTTAGYALARFRFGIGNRNLVSWFLSQRFLPPVATLIPFFLMLQELDLYDSRLGMIIVNATFVMPFAVLITRDFFADLPKDLEEAALVDGASHFQVFLRVALPIAGPAMVAAGIICFTFAWNEFLFASVLTVRDAQPFTIKISSTGTVRGIHFGFVSTRLLIAVLPPLVLSLFVQRYIVRGLTMGAVKG